MPEVVRPDRSLGSASHGEGRDRVLETGFWTPRRGALVAVAVLLAGALAWGFQGMRLDPSMPRVERSRLVISEVRTDAIRESISGAGVLVPRTTVLLHTVAGGRVEEVLVQNGTEVAAGQPLIRLSNSDLQLRLIDLEARRLNQVESLKDSRFRSEQAGLAERQELEEMDFQVQRMERRVARNERLHKGRLLSQAEKEDAEEELAYLRRKRSTAESTYQRSRELRDSHMRDLAVEVESLESSYGLLREALDDLVVRAPIDGRLTSLDIEVGELLPAGARLGKIDDLRDGYKLQADIDEFYLDRVSAGQAGRTLPLGGEVLELEVDRVYPEVVEGRFLVDLRLGGPVPGGSRRGQTVGIRLDLGEPSTALVVDRGPFYQSSGGNWVYVVSGQGLAERRPVRFGRLSSDSVEILDGLEPGEQVITSSYRAFGSADSVILE